MTGGKKKAPAGIGKRIQKIVDENRITKKEFAESLGVNPNYIYQLVSGKRTAISEPLARLIAALYGCPARWVMHGDGEDADGE